MAKDPNSQNRGGPTRSWLKVKRRVKGVFPIIGVAHTDGGYDGLLLAMRERGRLHYVGTVEWGVRRAVVDELVGRAARLNRGTPACDDAPRRRDVQWLEPRLMAEVSYASFTQGATARSGVPRPGLAY